MTNVNPPQPPPTELELQTLAAVLTHGGSKGAAYALRTSQQTIKNRLTNLYARLGAGNIMEATVRLGWTTVPAVLEPVIHPKECGWVGHCTRHGGHRGQHGGFRAGGRAA